MDSVGARLKKIRLEKGYSLEDVHKKTKIHYNVLTAIEEDRLVSFSPIYIKGFLKIYCAFLGVNPDEYLSNYRKEKSQPVVEEEKENKPLPVVNAVSLSKEKHGDGGIKKPILSDDLLRTIRDKIKIAIIIIVIIIAAVILVKMARVIISKISLLSQRIKSRPSQAVVPVVKKQKADDEVHGVKDEGRAVKNQRRETKGQGREKIEAKNQIVSAKASSKETIAVPIRLTMRTREDCWIQVKLDNKIVFQNILKKGRAESWQAKEKIELSLGNAGVVDLEVNGNLISSLGRRGQSVKNVLITKDGLNVPR